MTPFHISSRKVVYKNHYQKIYRVQVGFDGFTKEIYVNEYGQRVGLLIVRADEVLLVRQYRFRVNELAWELPGGKMDPGETPEQAAAREGLEETCRDAKILNRCCIFIPDWILSTIRPSCL
jgi:ADP-ribose pyrophosphatase